MPRSDARIRRRLDRERHRRRVQARIEARLCVRCARRPPVEGGRTCEHCRRKRRDADRDRAARRRKAGIKRVRDPKAREAEYARARQRVLQRKASGLCVKCGTVAAQSGLTLCLPCLRRRRAAERERYRKASARGRPYGGANPARKRREARRRSRKRRLARLRARLCVRCGAHKPVKGGSSCETCIEKRRATDRATYSARRADGLCTRCATATFEGAPDCGPCTVLEARYREAKNEANRRRYAERRAAWVCTRCSRPSFGASRCEPCAKRAWERSEQVKGLPVYPPSFTVVERATGTDHGTWESWEEVAIALSFARLSLEDVDVLIDHAPMHTTFID